MKFPSLQRLLQSIKSVLFRFPLEIFCALTGTVAMLFQIEQNAEDNELIRVVLCSILGLVLFLSVSVFSESTQRKKVQRALLQVLVVGLLVACWFSIVPVDNESSVIRFMLLSVAFHLLVSLAPHLRVEGFWEYNKQLFIRILTAQLYSWVLFAGLSIAVASADYLFSLDVDYKTYWRLFVLILGLFNTIFFLAGVPDNLRNLHEQYPKGLKVFTQYVLIPLATIYLFIILAYEGKVILEWALPQGTISLLILGYSVYGILSILLIYPIRLLEGNTWIKNYSRLFYFLLIPLLPLLCLAIGVRVINYGLTEPRYIVCALSLWLIGITSYFLISKKQNIKVIPATLAMVAILCAWGPQRASAISEVVQVNRLINIFRSQNRFANGLLLPMPATVSDSIGNASVGQLTYLVDTYGVSSIDELLPQQIKDSLQLTDTIKNKYNRNYAVNQAIRNGLALKSHYDRSESYNRYYTTSLANDTLSIRGFSSMKEFFLYVPNDENRIAKLRGDTLIVYQEADSTLRFNIGDILRRVASMQDSANVRHLLSQEFLESETRIASQRYKLLIKEIGFYKDSTTFKLEKVNGIVLFNE